MKCPICGAWSSVIETRENIKRESTRRRRKCANEHKFWTLEVFPGFINPEAAKRCLIGVEKSRARWVRDQAIRRDSRTPRELVPIYNLHIDQLRRIKRS